jgi:hypothetical protein
VKKTVKDWFNGLAADLYRNSSRDTGVWIFMGIM